MKTCILLTAVLALSGCRIYYDPITLSHAHVVECTQDSRTAAGSLTVQQDGITLHLKLQNDELPYCRYWNSVEYWQLDLNRFWLNDDFSYQLRSYRPAIAKAEAR